MDLEGRSDESGTDNWRFDLARRAPSRRRAFSYTERRVNGEPPHARGAVEGTGDRPPGSHPRLCRRGRAHLPGQDRQDVVPGAARGARGAAEALTFYADLRAGARRLEEPLFGAALFLEAAGFAVFRSFASSTLRLSASIRSTTGVSGTGSGFAISWPSSFASSIWRRSLRYWLCSSDGSNSPTRLSITCWASFSSASLTSVPATASSISACERTSSARKSVSSTSASPFGRMRQKYSAPRSTNRPIAPMFACFIASSRRTYGRRCATLLDGAR